MKHTKILFALLAVTAAVLAFGCKKATDPAGFTMNAAQKAAYENAITTVESKAANMELSANDVKTTLENYNKYNFNPLNFKVTDKESGKTIAKGTKADALKKRFVPSAK